ncbi:hypothetical protein TNCV_2746701 [Trichonephila clavipes]|nr:hypothetical protein TNCV_2746701 [Trichonephila clavipes]
MIPAYNKKRCAAFPFETGIHFRRKTDFFPEDATMSFSGFEPTRLQAEGHSHHTGWATLVCITWEYEYKKIRQHREHDFKNWISFLVHSLFPPIFRN